jgi:hypothetical protein
VQSRLHHSGAAEKRYRKSPATAAALRTGLADPATVGRYRAKVVEVPGAQCAFWAGAVTNRGHGRFWLTTDPATRTAYGVIAHRFGFGLATGSTR